MVAEVPIDLHYKTGTLEQSRYWPSKLYQEAYVDLEMRDFCRFWSDTARHCSIILSPSLVMAKTTTRPLRLIMKRRTWQQSKMKDRIRLLTDENQAA
ncbi:hypothetical protein MRB53_039842 [Persea americana]|nr:hypothetical protein MRB53_039842 [Persea americana]